MSEDGRRERPGALGEPGQELTAGEPAAPRQAATVILLRGGAQKLEVLLVKRTEKARFMGGVWVFPGGAVDERDGEPSYRSGAVGEHDAGPAHRAAAVRELAEEAGIALNDSGELVEFSRWITPAEVAVRFDTRFYLATLPDGQEPCVDGQECVDLGWFTPAGALEAFERQEIALVFPTIKHLEQLRPFASAEDLLLHARGREVRPVQPRVVLEGEIARVLLPGEPGY